MVHSIALLAEDVLPALQPFVRPSAATLLVERARVRLQSESHRLRKVSCDYHRGALRLRGEVPTYYLKQVAQCLLLSMSGSQRVQNDLVVVPPK